MKAIGMAAIAAAGVALAGCKTEFAAQVPLSALQDPQVSELPGKVRLEVMSCQHYEDSRQPSDSLVQAQEMMPRIFPSAEFQECYREGMDSWAEFDISLPIDRDGDPEQFASDDAFNLTTTPELPLGVAVPPAVMERLEQAQRAEMMMGNLTYAITLEVINDTDASFDVAALSAWVEGHPVTAQPMEVPPNQAFSLRFSDVLIDRAIERGEASVLIDLDYLAQQLSR
jgi:hypothetical protein